MPEDHGESSNDELPPEQHRAANHYSTSNHKRTTSTGIMERIRSLSRPTVVERDHESDFGSGAHGQLLGLSISIKIPFTRTGAGKHGGMKVLYMIRCTLAPPENAPVATPVKSWEVAKRFSEFSKLDHDIKDTLMKSFSSAEGAYGLALLPPRHLLASDFDEHVISERKKGFLKYLQSALNASFFFQDIQPILAMFLECPGAMKFGKGLRADASNGSEAASSEDKGTALISHTILGEAQHGFLYKHAGPNQLFKPFRLHFCVLNYADGIFRYYRPQQPVLLGEMKVKGIYGKVTNLEPKQFGIPSNAFGFSVWTTGRELILYAETSEDRTLWMQAFSSLLSSVIPSSAVALPVKSPHSTLVADSGIGSPLSLGESLIFREESRGLSLNEHRPSDASGGRNSMTGSNVDLTRDDSQQFSGVQISRVKKQSRGNSILESVHESQSLDPGSVPINTQSMRRDASTEGREKSSTLQLHTREALQASRRRSRTASSSSQSPVPRPKAGQLGSHSYNREMSGEVEEKASSPTQARAPRAYPAAVSLPASTIGSDPAELPRPRFPSNISIMTDAARQLREDSIRPPSYDADQSPRKLNSPARNGESLSSPWRGRNLPPPRFPSNLRLASSGGSSTPGVSPSHRLLVRGRPTHKFRIFQPMTSNISTRSVGTIEQDIESGDLFARALVRLKVDTLPTRNPHVLLALLATPNPWKGRAVNLMTPHQFSACLENIYYDTASLRRSAGFRPKATDVIVTSIARSGATPILLALDSFRSERLVSLEELPARVPWLEGRDIGENVSKSMLTPVDSARNCRLLKTTMPVRHALGIGGGQAISPSTPRVVVVLRDPLDIKLSWFRHCRRIYGKCIKKGPNFDAKFSLEDFAQVPMPCCNPTFAAAMSPNETYECYVREVLQLYTAGKTHNHMHLVFYEELLSDCENTVRKLAKFFDASIDDSLIRAVVDSIQDSPDFPSTLNERTGRPRVGSTGQGCKEFLTHEIDLLDKDWDRIVRSHFPDFDQYSTMYERLLDTPYPHPRVRPFDEAMTRARKSSGLGALALIPSGRKSLRELKRRLSGETPYHTGNTAAKTKKRVDPDDSGEEE